MRNLCFSLPSLLWLITDQVYAEPPFPVTATISGIADVRDGDGILFGDAEIRLQGIAAPEDNPNNREPGGRAATDALERLVKGRPVTCYLWTAPQRGNSLWAFAFWTAKTFGRGWCATALRVIALNARLGGVLRTSGSHGVMSGIFRSPIH